MVTLEDFLTPAQRDALNQRRRQMEDEQKTVREQEMDALEAKINQERAAVIDRIRELRTVCTTPAEQREVFSRATPREIDISDRPIMSPVTGKLHTTVKLGTYHVAALPDSPSEIYSTFYLLDDCGPTPEFFSIDDLAAYCELMRRAPAPFPGHTTGFFGEMQLTPGVIKTADDTIHGMYAVVGETGFQLGPQGPYGYAPYIESVHILHNEVEVDRAIQAVHDDNAKRDLPSHLSRVDVRLWYDKGLSNKQEAYKKAKQANAKANGND